MLGSGIRQRQGRRGRRKAYQGQSTALGQVTPMSECPIFLSYTRVDDTVTKSEPDRPGWVRFFHDHLREELRQRVSHDLHFWRDVEDIEPDARFAREIEEALRRAMLMI